MKERLMSFILAMAILSNVLIVSTNVVYADITTLWNVMPRVT